MGKRQKSYYEGEAVMNFNHPAFEKDLREAQLNSKFPNQRQLQTPLDEVLWILWVLRDHFEHRIPAYASEIAHALEVRGVALDEVQVERTLARAARRVIKRKFDKTDTKSAYAISEKGVAYLESKYAISGIKALVVDGSKPWTDRHLTLPEIASELKGRICVVDKFYGSSSLAILHHFKHGRPLQFLTGKTNESATVFSRELRDFQKEVPSMEARIYSAHHDLHDRYIISINALVIIGHGIKDIGSKESFLILLKGDTTADLRKTLLDKFDSRWKIASPLV
ncbi:MAG: hypothetical protein ABSH11_12275 [Verrucomicrobiota bacterium]|jgi:hypothetical protein